MYTSYGISRMFATQHWCTGMPYFQNGISFNTTKESTVSLLVNQYAFQLPTLQSRYVQFMAKTRIELMIFAIILDLVAVKSYLDIMSPIDYKEQRLSRNEARKQISKILSQHSENIRFSRHSLDELKMDNLTPTDGLNVLKSPDAKLNMDGEWANGSYRYRLETANILVVVGFWKDGSGFNVITAWDKQKGRTTV